MKADTLISLVLAEGSLDETSKTRKTALIDVRDMGDDKPAEITAGNRTAARRMANFPKTLGRFSAAVSKTAQPELPLNQPPYEGSLDQLLGAVRQGERYQTRDRILGPKTTSAQREMRIGILLPTLAHRAGLLEQPTVNTSHIPSAHKKEAKAEFNRLIGIEADHIQRRNDRVLRRMVGIGTVHAGRNALPYQDEPHDAWDHGYTGTTPSEMGEVEAGDFERRFRRENGNPEEYEDLTLTGLTPEKKRRVALEWGLKSLFTGSSHALVRHDIPHETLMAWSRAMQPRKKRKKFLDALKMRAKARGTL